MNFYLDIMLFAFTYFIVHVFAYFVAHWFTLKWLLPTFSKLRVPLLLFNIFSTIASPVLLLGSFYLGEDYVDPYVFFGGTFFHWLIVYLLPKPWRVPDPGAAPLLMFPILVYSCITFVAIAHIIFLIFYAKQIGISRTKMIKPAFIASIIGWIVAHICGVLAHIALAITVA